MPKVIFHSMIVSAKWGSVTKGQEVVCEPDDERLVEFKQLAAGGHCTIVEEQATPETKTPAQETASAAPARETAALPRGKGKK